MPVIETASVKYTFSQLAQKGKETLRIHFPSSTITEAGTYIARDVTKDTPYITVLSSLVKQDAKYILVQIDLDAPFASAPFLAPICHGINTDLVVSGEVDAAGFVKLESSVPAVVPHGPAGPPPLAAPHRYVFMLWQQTERSGEDQIRAALALEKGKEVAISSRMRFDEEGFEKNMNLSAEPLAGNYFTSN